MVYPIGTVLFQLFRSYHSRMNKSSLLDNQYEILILFHFHDVTQRWYDQGLNQELKRSGVKFHA